MNKKRCIILFFIGLLWIGHGFGAQKPAWCNKDSLFSLNLRSQDIVVPEFQFKQIAVPVALMTYGAIETAVAPHFDLLNAQAHNAVNIYITP